MPVSLLTKEATSLAEGALFPAKEFALPWKQPPMALTQSHPFFLLLLVPLGTSALAQKEPLFLQNFLAEVLFE